MADMPLCRRYGCCPGVPISLIVVQTCSAITIASGKEGNLCTKVCKTLFPTSVEPQRIRNIPKANLA